MIPCFIPLKWHSTNNYTELMFALRSLEKYMSNVSHVIILGLTKPKWSNDNLIFVKAPDPSKFTAINIKEKLLMACDIVDGNSFLMFHDDHFLIDDFDCMKLPQFYQGTLHEQVMKSKYMPHYKDQLQNTLRVLTDIKNPLFWDVHFPITFQKQSLKEILNRFNWNINQGYAIKSLYCNLMGFRGIPIEEAIISRPLRSMDIIDKTLEDRPFFSTHEGAINELLLEKINELYPNKSTFEI